MYENLPRELKAAILKYLNQRDLVKLCLAYDGRVPELEAFKRLTFESLSRLYDCRDLVGIKTNWGVKPDLNIPYESDSDSNYSKRSNFSSPDAYTKSEFYPIFIVDKDFNQGHLEHLYTISEFLKQITFKKYVDMDWSRISNRVYVVLKIGNVEMLQGYFKKGLDRVDHIILKESGLVSQCNELAKIYGWGKVCRWTLDGKKCDRHQPHYLESPNISDLSVVFRYLDKRSFKTMLRIPKDQVHLKESLERISSIETAPLNRVPLKKLAVRYSSFEDRDFASFIDIISKDQPELESLDLSHNRLHRDTTIKLCSWIQSGNCKLKVLDLDCCFYVDLELLFNTLTATPNSIRNLKFKFSSDVDVQVSAFLTYFNSKNNHLETMLFDLPDDRDTIWAELSIGLKSRQSKLKDLRIRSTAFIEKSKVFFEAIDASRIETFKLLCCTFGGYFHYLTYGFPKSNLTSLVLIRCHLCDDQIFMLGKALEVTERHLKLVDLRGNEDITVDGLHAFVVSLLKRRCPISILDIRQIPCNPGMFRSLCRYPRKVGRVLFGSTVCDYSDF